MSAEASAFWLGLSIGIPTGIALSIIIKAWLIILVDRYGPAGKG